jgi:DNA methylase
MCTREELLSQRPPGECEDVHFTESLAAAVIDEYSDEGDVVLDPFAGFGTTPASLRVWAAIRGQLADFGAAALARPPGGSPPGAAPPPGQHACTRRQSSPQRNRR